MGRQINPETGHGYSWKGDSVSYRRLHTWLRETYGSASKCEDEDCDGTCQTFQYALIKGKTYKRSRENFIQLCVKCHSRYDGHADKVRKALMGHCHSEETKKKIGIANSKKIWTLEERLKLSIAQKKRYATYRITSA